MIDSVSLRTFLQGVRKEHGWPLEEVAKRAGMAVSTLQRFDVGDVANVPPSAVVKLAKGYEVSVIDILQAAGYNVGLEVIDEAAKLQGIKQTSLADFVRINYGVKDTDMLVRSLELAIKGQLQTEVEGKDNS